METERPTTCIYCKQEYEWIDTTHGPVSVCDCRIRRWQVGKTWVVLHDPGEKVIREALRTERRAREEAIIQKDASVNSKDKAWQRVAELRYKIKGARAENAGLRLLLENLRSAAKRTLERRWLSYWTQEDYNDFRTALQMAADARIESTEPDFLARLAAERARVARLEEAIKKSLGFFGTENDLIQALAGESLEGKNYGHR